MRPPLRAAAAVAVVAGLLAGTPHVAPTAASWRALAFAGGSLRTSAADCSSTGVFLQSAAASMLAGTVQGTPIQGATALAGVTAGPTAAAATSTRSLQVDAVGTAPSVGGTALPVALTPRAEFEQTATTTGRGAATAAAGSTAPFGTVDVSGALARSTAGATALPGLTQVALDVGPVTAAAADDGCRRAWGDATLAGPNRSAAVGSLGLRFRDAAVAGYLVDEGTASDGVVAAVAGLAADPATRSAIGTAAGVGLVADVGAVLGVGYSVTPTSVVTITTGSAGVAAARAATAGDPAGPASLNGGTGEAAVDLGALAGGLGDPPPNTAVLSTARTTALGASLGGAVGRHAAGLAAAWAGMRDDAVVRVQTTAAVSLLGLGGALTPAGSVSVDMTGTVAGWTGTTPVVTVAPPTATGAVPSANLAAITARLGAVVVPAVRTALQTAFVVPSTTAATAGTAALTAAVATRSAVAATETGRLAGVLTATLNLQPDRSPNPAGWTTTAASGQWVASALRVRVLPGSGELLDLLVGNVSVGPDVPPS